MRALGLKQRILARPLVGRPLGHLSSRKAGIVRPHGRLFQKPCLHASEALEEVIFEQLRRVFFFETIQALGLKQHTSQGRLLGGRKAGIVRPRSGLPGLHAPKGRRESHLFEQLRRFEIIKKARKRDLGIFFHLCACARISTEVRQPQAENSVAVLQLSMRSLARSRSLSIISLRPRSHQPHRDPRRRALAQAESHRTLEVSRRKSNASRRLRDLGQVKNKVDYVSEEAVYGQATRAQRTHRIVRKSCL